MEYYKEKREQKRDIWRNKNQEFSKTITDTKPQIHKPVWRTWSRNKQKQKQNPPHVIFKIKKAKTEEKLKESREIKTLYLYRNKS